MNCFYISQLLMQIYKKGIENSKYVTIDKPETTICNSIEIGLSQNLNTNFVIL